MWMTRGCRTSSDTQHMHALILSIRQWLLTIQFRAAAAAHALCVICYLELFLVELKINCKSEIVKDGSQHICGHTYYFSSVICVFLYL